MLDPGSNPQEYKSLTKTQKKALQFWISRAFTEAKTINRNQSFYGLKHHFEFYGFYVNNGAFKGAMLKAGYRPDNHYDLNWLFKIKKPTRKHLPRDFPNTNMLGAEFIYYWSLEDLTAYLRLLEQVIFSSGAALAEQGKGNIELVIQYIKQKRLDSCLTKYEPLAAWNDYLTNEEDSLNDEQFITLADLEKRFYRRSEGRELTSRTKTEFIKSRIAHNLAKNYGDRLKWNNYAKTWMGYEEGLMPKPGCWGKRSEETIRSFVQEKIGDILEGDIAAEENYFNSAFIGRVYKLFKSSRQIFMKGWPEFDNLRGLPFENGVLDYETKSLEPHKPDNYLLWVLPGSYDPATTDWSEIKRWLDLEKEGNDLLKSDYDYIFYRLKNSSAVTTISLSKWQHLYSEVRDYIFTFLNDCCIFDEFATTRVGGKAQLPDLDDPLQADSIYQAALVYWKSRNLWNEADKPPVSGNVISQKIITLAREMGYAVSIKKNRFGSSLLGIRLRKSTEDTLTFLSSLEKKISNSPTGSSKFGS